MNDSNKIKEADALIKLEKMLEGHDDIKQEMEYWMKRPDLALRWMTTQKGPLLNRTPESLLNTEPEAVLDMLVKIKTGDMS